MDSCRLSFMVIHESIFIIRPEAVFIIFLFSFCLRKVVCLHDIEHIIRMQPRTVVEELLYGKEILRISVSCVFVVGMLCRSYLSERNGRTPLSCRMHLLPDITASSSFVISSFPSF